MSRKIAALVTLAVGVLLAGAVPAAATSHGGAFPAEFSLPNGFAPEGIAIGDAPVAYFGSRLDGSLYRADLRTGQGSVFSKGPGTPSLGLKIDQRGRLFVAGGVGGDSRVVDSRTGKVLASYRFAEGTDTFVNDVVLTDDAAWFTDSRRAALYKLSFGRHGSLPSTFTTLPLTGEFAPIPGAVNANGIVTSPDGKSLVLVQSNVGKLFTVNPRTGATKAVDLGGTLVTNGDGLLREGSTLYVVQNRDNVVTKVKLSRTGETGEVTGRITSPTFDVPTTVASYGNRLYLPNARFGVTPTPETPFNAVAVPKR